MVSSRETPTATVSLVALGGKNLHRMNFVSQCPHWFNFRNEKTPLLLGTQDFTVLIKNSIEFPEFGPQYKRRNILDSATNVYLQQCLYNERTDPYCPTFRIGDIVKAAKQDYNAVGLTGAVFGIQIRWDCSFDWGKSIKDCLPKYSFSRLDNPNALISPGFNFR